MPFYVLLLYRRMVVDIMLSGDFFWIIKHIQEKKSHVEGKQKGIFIDDKSNWNFLVLGRFKWNSSG